MLDSSEVVGDKDPCGFLIESLIVFSSLTIGRHRAGEPKINRKTLIGLLGNTCRVMAPTISSFQHRKYGTVHVNGNDNVTKYGINDGDDIGGIDREKH